MAARRPALLEVPAERHTNPRAGWCTPVEGDIRVVSLPEDRSEENRIQAEAGRARLLCDADGPAPDRRVAGRPDTARRSALCRRASARRAAPHQPAQNPAQ